MPNAQNTLLQSRLINSPPVKGMMKADDVDDCERFDGEDSDVVGSVVEVNVGADVGEEVGTGDGVEVGALGL